MTLPFLRASASYDGNTLLSRRASESAARWLSVRPEGEGGPADPGDAALVARLRRGESPAFRELWDAYHARLADFAMRYLGSRDGAADVVQDVFIALWERHADIDIRGSVAGYLYGMVRHTVLDIRKHERVVRRHEELTASAYLSAPTVARNLGADALDVEALQRTVRRVVSSLPPRTREIFLMSREDGLAPGAIAAVLGIAPQAVYNQLSRALGALHDAIASDS